MKCNHPRCDTEAKPGHFACGIHWFQLPIQLREAIADFFRRDAPVPGALEHDAHEYWLSRPIVDISKPAPSQQLSFAGTNETHEGGELGTCSGCGRRIIWGKTAEDKTIPLDASAPVYAFAGGVLERTRAYVSHFVTCPQRDRFSGSRSAEASS